MSGDGYIYIFIVQVRNNRRRSTRIGKLKENVSAMYMGHVCFNDRTHDRLAVCSILEAGLFCRENKIPELRYLHIITDNANCYQNDLLAAEATFITKEHGLFESYIPRRSVGRFARMQISP